MTRKPTSSKRLNLVVPNGIWQELESEANEEQTTAIDLIRRFARLGARIYQLQVNNPNAQLIIRDEDTGKEKQIIML